MVKDKTSPLDEAEDWERSELRQTYRFMPVSCISTLRKLHAYRLEHEASNGPTPDRLYTSQLSANKQEELLKRDLQTYLLGLPEFAKKFYEDDAKQRAKNGKLDTLPEAFISLFVRNRGRLMAALPVVLMGLWLRNWL